MRDASGDSLGLIGHTIDGQLRVESFVGKGEVTCVYRARHLVLEAPVALQVSTVSGEGARRVQQAFTEAVRLHYRLERKTLHVARVMSQGLVAVAAPTAIARPAGEPAPYLVREWFEGGALARYLAERRRRGLGGRPLADVILALAPVARALEHAHAEGIAHLAVNPRTILLPGTRPEEAKLAEFGFAVSGREPLRPPLAAYAAPEQLGFETRREDPLTPAADVYALALLVLELLRDLPVHAIDATRTEVIEGSGQATRRAADPALPREAREVLSRALGRDPLGRHLDVTSFWEELVHASTATPSLPQIPGAGARPSPRPFPAVDDWDPDAVTAPKLIPPRVPAGAPLAAATPAPLPPALPPPLPLPLPPPLPPPAPAAALAAPAPPAPPAPFAAVRAAAAPTPTEPTLRIVPPANAPLVPLLPKTVIDFSGTPSFDALAAAQNKPEGAPVTIDMTPAPLPLAHWPQRARSNRTPDTTVRILRQSTFREVLVGLASFLVVSALGFAAVFFFGDALHSVQKTTPEGATLRATPSPPAADPTAAPASRSEETGTTP